MIKDLPEGETQYDHFDELIAQLRVARDNFYRSKAMQETALREECETLRRERDTFYMDYRMKCDAETKALCGQLAAMTAERNEWKLLHDNQVDTALRIQTQLAAEQAYSQQLRDAGEREDEVERARRLV